MEGLKKTPGSKAGTTDERRGVNDHEDHEFPMFRHHGHKTTFHRAHATRSQPRRHDTFVFLYIPRHIEHAIASQKEIVPSLMMTMMTDI